MTRTERLRPLPGVASVVSVLMMLAVLTACSTIDDLTGADDSAAPPPAAAAATPYDSQFTRDGTFQSHIDVDGIDFVYTLYPTKSTPRTNEWYPKGSKYFSFTFQGYDLKRRLRDPFRSKRKIYLSHMTVTSATRTGGGRTEHPYRLDAEAKRVTFDPEAASTRYGMLITSPKGAFELRNQRIRPTSMSTKGIDLYFAATVWIQQTPGSTSFYKRIIRQRVPIAIFPNDEPTRAQPIPVDAN